MGPLAAVTRWDPIATASSRKWRVALLARERSTSCARGLRTEGLVVGSGDLKEEVCVLWDVDRRQGQADSGERDIHAPDDVLSPASRTFRRTRRELDFVQRQAGIRAHILDMKMRMSQARWRTGSASSPCGSAASRGGSEALDGCHRPSRKVPPRGLAATRGLAVCLMCSEGSGQAPLRKHRLLLPASVLGS